MNWYIWYTWIINDFCISHYWVELMLYSEFSLNTHWSHLQLEIWSLFSGAFEKSTTFMWDAVAVVFFVSFRQPPAVLCGLDNPLSPHCLSDLPPDGVNVPVYCLCCVSVCDCDHCLRCASFSAFSCVQKILDVVHDHLFVSCTLLVPPPPSSFEKWNSINVVLIIWVCM